MSRSITIDPLTRIEGHARVEVDIDDQGQVTHTLFKVMDFRGWETFLVGTQVEMMPTVTARICGTCSVSHHLASAKTVDKVFGTQPPRAARLLRYALNLAGYIHSHGVHLFALAGPDILLGIDADPARRNIVGLIDAAPDLAKKALRLRAISTQIGETIGGRGVHPVSSVAGGVAKPLAKEKKDRMERLSKEALELAREVVTVFKKTLTGGGAAVPSLPLETHYLGLVNKEAGKGQGALDHYQGELRLRSPDGGSFDFPEDRWTDHLFEETVPSSYAKHVFCQPPEGDAVSYRVGPLARLNCCDSIDTPLAQAELEAFREMGGFPCHETVMYHFARGIELLYAAEKLVELFSDEETYSDRVRDEPRHGPRDATGLLEAPRGVLIHDYKVDENGLLTGVNLLVATQQNIPSINAVVGMSAARFLDQPDALLLNGIEFGVRCYDPCLSCATHRIGEMKLDVIVRREGEVIRRARR
jgi:F420-non-reducing hydrogenase large subunit